MASANTSPFQPSQWSMFSECVISAECSSHQMLFLRPASKRGHASPSHTIQHVPPCYDWFENLPLFDLHLASINFLTDRTRTFWRRWFSLHLKMYKMYSWTRATKWTEEIRLPYGGVANSTGNQFFNYWIVLLALAVVVVVVVSTISSVQTPRGMRNVWWNDVTSNVNRNWIDYLEDSFIRLSMWTNWDLYWFIEFSDLLRSPCLV